MHPRAARWRRTVAVLWAAVSAGCGLEGDSVRHHPPLTGCEHETSAQVPDDGNYYLTSFGGSSDSGQMFCGADTDHGSWFYAASSQRYGCGAHLQVEANGGCVVVQADDSGPDVCVENAAGGPILDASPLVARVLFGVGSAGWSDHFPIHVARVPDSTPLGTCQTQATAR